ncbi:MAG: hypothetical protein CMP12_20695 [Zunongwangia sp.]|uniref:DUF4403 family protein n=1 Tax=Zunongwangia profunda TaxID=398743 RepID=A0A3D5J3N6_9FLAO|nr:DUF4403 family protein [Zunongwangia profunda]MAO38278.1 hypothetical protein [Zunongwangia sp.]MAS72907.1 hypothetical protein [Zunongwangia sp.]HAJ81372.1 hypothetical protein [Zunongwangia profunda]HCV82617.1 hypothetical protein [Zunongwangia profunda]|tara:strand:+ start:833 stop:1438 length:606 start_codon:yes stop_codon:yes gene_type:complete
MNEDYQKGLILNIPVKLPYAVLEKVIEEKLQEDDGEENGMAEYAEVKFAWLEKNPEVDYDITLGLRLKAKTFLFKNKELELKIHLKFNFDPVTNQFSLEDYEAVGENQNRIMNKIVQVILNKFLQKKVLQKSRQNLSEKLKQELDKINTKLRENDQPAEGLLVEAQLDQLNISHFEFAPQELYIYLSLTGEAVMEVTKIPE